MLKKKNNDWYNTQQFAPTHREAHAVFPTVQTMAHLSVA